MKRKRQWAWLIVAAITVVLLLLPVRGWASPAEAVQVRAAPSGLALAWQELAPGDLKGSLEPLGYTWAG